MTEKNQPLIQAGMRFIEEMTASAMHELKNKLAIINENSGLVQDLSEMARQKGRSLDIERIENISTKIQEQVHRSDKIIKKVNQFSHDMDQPVQSVDLLQALNVVMSMGDRLIEKHGCLVNVELPESPIEVNTHLFHLKNILWRVLEPLCRSAGAAGQVDIFFAQRKIVFKIMNSDDAGPQYDAVLDSEEIAVLAQYLSAQLMSEDNSSGISLLLNDLK